jgi:hypothetical protein
MKVDSRHYQFERAPVHAHKWKLEFDEQNTKIEKHRPKGGEQGTNGFVNCVMPRCYRRCECGAVEELISGSWNEMEERA